MSRRIGTVVALAVGLVFAGRALACDSADGAVAKIDAAKNTLIVKGSCCDQKEMAFVLKKETKIRVNGKTATLADLRAGDKVQVQFEKLDDVTSVTATREG